MFVKPTVEDFKTYFSRDFPYNEDPSLGVTDGDITKAMGEADDVFNPNLFSTQESFSRAYLLLTAHFLVMDLRAASQGLSGSYSWITTSKSVGNVSESYGVPQRILDNPTLGMLSKTPYGAKYLHLIYPLLLGGVSWVPGRTHP